MTDKPSPKTSGMSETVLNKLAALETKVDIVAEHGNMMNEMNNKLNEILGAISELKKAKAAAKKGTKSNTDLATIETFPKNAMLWWYKSYPTNKDKLVEQFFKGSGAIKALESAKKKNPDDFTGKDEVVLPKEARAIWGEASPAEKANVKKVFESLRDEFEKSSQAKATKSAENNKEEDA